MIIQITEIHPPRIGGKVSKIVAADGQQFEIWPEKLVGVDVGRHSEVAAFERQFNGRIIKSIKKIAPTENSSAEISQRVSQSTPIQKTCDASGEADYVGRVPRRPDQFRQHREDPNRHRNPMVAQRVVAQ